VFSSQDFIPLAHKFTNEFSCFFCLGDCCFGNVGFLPDCLRVRVAYFAAQAFAAQDKYKAVFFLDLQNDFHAGDAHFLHQFPAKFLAHFGRDAAGAPVSDDAFGIDSAEVPARGHVALLQIEINTQR